MRAQCPAGPGAGTPLELLFREQKWAAIVQLAEAETVRTPSVNFDYGMALAHLGRWSAAHRALIAGERQCPRDKRFPVELAGVAFEQKRYPEATHWLRRGLRLDPGDAYANDFLGTVYFLMGNLQAAVQTWNRADKPKISTFDFDPHLRVHRLILDRAFAFSPAAVMHEQQLATTEARLDGLGIFPGYSIRLDSLPDGNFDAVFRAQELNGFGASRLQAIVSTFGGSPYETVYPEYSNIGRAAMNFASLFRWDAQKRRAWLSLSAPPLDRPQRRWTATADLRNENWAVRRSFTGVSPVLGSLNLERQEGSFGLTSFASGHFSWSIGAGLSHRTFRTVVEGSALIPSLLTSGYAVEGMGSVDKRLIDNPGRRFSLDGDASGEVGRMSTPTHSFQKIGGSALAHWFPQAEGDNYELSQQLRAGKIFGTPPFDELYLFGMDRDDTDLWLRGHIATRDGRKGSAPVGDAYMLSNTDFFRRVYSNGLLAVHAGPLLDIGKMAAPTNGLSSGEWLFDTGIEARVTVLHTSVVLSYGRDLRNGANAFYGNVAPAGALP